MHLGHIVRMKYKSLEKKVFLSDIEVLNRRARPHRKWKDRVKVYMTERGIVGYGGLE